MNYLFKLIEYTLLIIVCFFNIKCPDESFSKNRSEQKKLKIFYSSDLLGQMSPCG